MSCDLEHTFVTSDHHFYAWRNHSGVFAESSEADDQNHIDLWNSVVGKDDLVLYVGDFCDGNLGDLETLSKKLNGRKVLIKGNHDGLGDEWYREMFSDVVSELSVSLLH